MIKDKLFTQYKHETIHEKNKKQNTLVL